MVEAIKEIREYREFLREYVLQLLRARYRGSVLGFFWTLLNPLLVCVCFTLVFAVINRVTIREFMPWFLGGYVPWLFFLNAGTMATSAIVMNSHYVSRVYVPKSIFPLATVLLNVVDLLAGLVIVLLLLLVLMPDQLSPALLVLPFAVVVMTIFCTGVAFLFAALNVFFRDFSFLWASISFLWFFFTPILYRVEGMPPIMRGIFAVNIIYPPIALFQEPIGRGVFPSAEIVVTSVLYAAIMLIVGTSVFLRSQRQFYMYV